MERLQGNTMIADMRKPPMVLRALGTILIGALYGLALTVIFMLISSTLAVSYVAWHILTL
jgi:hypothetical protein